MRGDSLRDFYAKTLAVLGLGLIAGAGAIVDYWPTGIRLPAATSPSIARLTVPPLVQNLNQQVPAPTLVVSRESVHSMNARHVHWPAFTARPQAAVAILRPAAFKPAPSAAPVLPAAEPVAAKPGAPVSYTTPVSEFAPDMLASSQLSAEQLDAPGGPPSPTGFIGGALKRTKDSLARTGAVTSASLGNAVRGVVGAFKKVSPF